MDNTNKPLTGSVTIVTRTVIFILIWWALSDGANSSWSVGIPAVLLTVVASIMLIPPVTVVWYELLKFLPFFLLHSLIGGLDVALRAFHPAMPIEPGLIDYPLRLPPGLPRVFMSNTVNLLPGTLNAAFDRNLMKVHVLDIQKPFLAEIETIENRVAAIFGISLELTQAGNSNEAIQ